MNSKIPELLHIINTHCRQHNKNRWSVRDHVHRDTGTWRYDIYHGSICASEYKLTELETIFYLQGAVDIIEQNNILKNDTLVKKENLVSVLDVASYILHKMPNMIHLKLQKLLYYTQAWSLVWDDQPLFVEEIEVWSNGPIVDPVFKKLRGKFSVCQEDLGEGNIENLTSNQKETIDAVLNFYGQRKTQYLNDLIHMEDPWQKSLKSKTIQLDWLYEYYSSLSEEDSPVLTTPIESNS